MARRSFRGAGGVGAVVMPYAHPFACNDSADDWEMTAAPQEARDVDRRTGALMVVASAVITLVGIFAVASTFGG
jgi:hypothetical protein